MNTVAAPPLTADDFDALEAELDLMREQNEDIPEWEFCEGFLVALVCCRRRIEPEEYWPVLLGEHFHAMEHMEFVWRWRRRLAEIETGLDADVETLEDERTYHPEALDLKGTLLAAPEEERAEVDMDKVPSYGQLWALGFLYAVETWPEEWAPPRDAEAADMLDQALDAIAALAEPDTGKPALSLHEENGPPSVSEQRLDDFGAAIWAIYDLRQYGRSMGPRVETIRKAPEPGRNDLCPCGSGKKYKKCCGA